MATKTLEQRYVSRLQALIDRRTGKLGPVLFNDGRGSLPDHRCLLPQSADELFAEGLLAHGRGLTTSGDRASWAFDWAKAEIEAHFEKARHPREVKVVSFTDYEAGHGLAPSESDGQDGEYVRPSEERLEQWERDRENQRLTEQRARLVLLDKALMQHLDERSFRIYKARQARRSVADVAAANRIGAKTVQRSYATAKDLASTLWREQYPEEPLPPELTRRQRTDVR